MAAKIADIARSRRVKAYLRITITVTTDGVPQLAQHFDQTAIDAAAAAAAAAAADGWYPLITNIPGPEAAAADILIQYEGEAVVQRRYGDVKGPHPDCSAGCGPFIPVADFD